MIVKYKGFEIEVVKNKSMIYGTVTYYSVFRMKDNWELTCAHEKSNEKVRDVVESLKDMVDGYLLNPKDYEENINNQEW